MNDQRLVCGETVWIVPANELLDAAHPSTIAFLAELDLISGNSATFPEEDRGRAFREEAIAHIRSAAAANRDKLLVLRNDLKTMQAVYQDEVERMPNIWPLRLYTWRHVIWHPGQYPGGTGAGQHLINPPGNLLRTAAGFLIAIDDPAAAQILAAQFAESRFGDDALDAIMTLLETRFPYGADFGAAAPGVVHDVLVYREESARPRVSNPVHATSETLAANIAAIRNEIEKSLVLTDGTRKLWSMASISPLWQKYRSDHRVNFNVEVERQFGANCRASGDVLFRNTFRDKTGRGHAAANIISTVSEYLGEFLDFDGTVLMKVYQNDNHCVSLRNGYGTQTAIIIWEKQN